MLTSRGCWGLPSGTVGETLGIVPGTWPVFIPLAPHTQVYALHPLPSLCASFLTAQGNLSLWPLSLALWLMPRLYLKILLGSRHKWPLEH